MLWDFAGPMCGDVYSLGPYSLLKQPSAGSLLMDALIETRCHHRRSGWQETRALVDDILGNALKLMGVELHYILVLDVISFVNKSTDNVVIVITA